MLPVHETEVIPKDYQRLPETAVAMNLRGYEPHHVAATHTSARAVC